MVAAMVAVVAAMQAAAIVVVTTAVPLRVAIADMAVVTGRLIALHVLMLRLRPRRRKPRRVRLTVHLPRNNVLVMTARLVLVGIVRRVSLTIAHRASATTARRALAQIVAVIVRIVASVVMLRRVVILRTVASARSRRVMIVHRALTGSVQHHVLATTALRLIAAIVNRVRHGAIAPRRAANSHHVVIALIAVVIVVIAVSARRSRRHSSAPHVRRAPSLRMMPAQSIVATGPQARRQRQRLMAAIVLHGVLRNRRNTRRVWPRGRLRNNTLFIGGRATGAP